jgi:hypothetical protein
LDRSQDPTPAQTGRRRRHLGTKSRLSAPGDPPAHLQRGRGAGGGLIWPGGRRNGRLVLRSLRRCADDALAQSWDAKEEPEPNLPAHVLGLSPPCRPGRGATTARVCGQTAFDRLVRAVESRCRRSRWFVGRPGSGAQGGSSRLGVAGARSHRGLGLIIGRKRDEADIFCARRPAWRFNASRAEIMSPSS